MKNSIVLLTMFIGLNSWASSPVKAGTKEKMNRKISCVEDCPCDLTAQEKEMINLARAQVKAGSNGEVSDHMAKKMQDQFIETSSEESSERAEIHKSLENMSADQLKAVKGFIQKIPR